MNQFDPQKADLKLLECATIIENIAKSYPANSELAKSTTESLRRSGMLITSSIVNHTEICNLTLYEYLTETVVEIRQIKGSVSTRSFIISIVEDVTKIAGHYHNLHLEELKARAKFARSSSTSSTIKKSNGLLV